MSQSVNKYNIGQSDNKQIMSLGVRNEQIFMYKSAYKQLQYSFKNNLNVIKQLQQENKELHEHLSQIQEIYKDRIEKQLKQQNKKHQQQLTNIQIEYSREIQLIKNQYQDFISTLNQTQQQKQHELIKTLTKKHQTQIQQIKNNLIKQQQKQQQQTKTNQQLINSLKSKLSSTENQLNNQNLSIITYQTNIQKLNKQILQSQTLYTTYHQQLQTIKNSNNSWEQLLKQRIQQLENQNNNLQQQITQQKFIQKQKIKKIINENNKKTLQQQQNYTQKINQILKSTKQIKFKFQTIKQQNIQLQTQIQITKRQLTQNRKELEEQKLKYTSTQDCLLIIKQKQYQIKSLEEEIKRIKAEKSEIQQTKQKIKNELQKVNFERQTAQKGLERLKVELLNRSKQAQQLKKQIQKIKYQKKISIPYNKNQLTKNNNELMRNNKNQIQGLGKQRQTEIKNNGGKNREQQQNVDYSRCFTEDMGPIDQNFFNPNSSIRPPLKISYDQIHQHQQDDTQSRQYYEENEQVKNQNYEGLTKRQQQSKRQRELKETITQLMKRVGELQVQNDQYKEVVKSIKQEMQRTNLVIEDKLNLKQREIRLGKQQNMMLRERLNDKQEQIIGLKQSIRKTKQQLLENNESNKLSKEGDKKRLVDKQNQMLKEENEKMRRKIDQLNQQIEGLIQERQTIQEIADQLKQQLDTLKNQYQSLTYQNQTQSNINPIHQPYQHHQFNNINTHQNHFIKQSNIPHSIHQNKSKTPSKHTNTQQKTTNNQPHLTSNNHQNNLQNPISNTHQNNISNPISNTHQKPSNTKPNNTKRKLHELIKQKNTLQILNSPLMGRKANLQKRIDQERTQHVGTKSQKQVYERLEKVSKSRSKQKILPKLKDFQIPQSLSINSKQSLPLQKRVGLQPSNQQKHQNQEGQDVQYRERIGMINRLREQLKNESLGEFDHLQNVSLTYWEQQV